MALVKSNLNRSVPYFQGLNSIAMLISKLKKQLKKTLIESYLKYDKSFFLLESSLKSHSNLQKAIFSTHLIGSNFSHVALTLSLSSFCLKFPTVLKVFLNDQKYDHIRVLSKPDLGASKSVLIKRSNLILKSKIHYVNPLNQKYICTEFKTIVFVFIHRVKNIVVLSKSTSNVLEL